MTVPAAPPAPTLLRPSRGTPQPREVPTPVADVDAVVPRQRGGDLS